MNRPLPPPPPVPSASLLFANNDKDQNSQQRMENPIILAHSVTLNDEHMKTGLVHLVILEIQRMSQLRNKELGALIVTNALLQPLLQNGPLCGLVALAMAAQQLNSEDAMSIDLIFREAKKRGYTKSGEMFSVQNMKNLAEDLLRCQSIILDTSLEDGSILTSLLKGHLALVPYDADFNHGPAQRHGHSAHWCLVNGLVLFLDKNQLEYFGEPSQPDQGDGENSVIFMSPNEIEENHYKILKEVLNTLDKGNVYVVARQGKSKQIGLWNYSELIKSNQNLTQISPKILEKPNDFVLLPIETSLCSQAIILSPTK